MVEKVGELSLPEGSSHMIRIYRKLVVLALFAGLVLCGSSTLADWSGGLLVQPTEATANSIWDAQGPVWHDEDNQDTVEFGLYIDGRLISPLIPAGATDDGGLMFYMSFTAGLNMSDPRQQPNMEWPPDPDDPYSDANNPLLLRSPYIDGFFNYPNGIPVVYAPNLIAMGGEPTSHTISFGAFVTYLPDEEGNVPDPQFFETDAVSVIVHDSTPYTMIENSVDWGGYLRNLDTLTAYPGNNWPSIIPPDPVRVVKPSVVVPGNPTAPDDGASSDTWEFRVVYRNEDGLPPKPWFRPWADEWDRFARTGRRTDNSDPPEDPYLEETGVVLFFDFMDVFDLSSEHRQEGYRPHFMRKENPLDSDYRNGVVYYYRLQPACYPWMSGDAKITATDPFYPPTTQIGNDYIALLTGSYHYFFACSDDHLYWTIPDEQIRVYVGEVQGDGWGQTGFLARHETRSSTMLDPSLPRELVDADGNPFMPRAEGRRYSTYGIIGDPTEPKDVEIYVDRVNLVPGRFEFDYAFQYPYPATEHPIVSCGLMGYDTNNLNGFGRFLGTIVPYYRGVNPMINTPLGSTGFTYRANRAETSFATTSTAVKFRIKYFQAFNKPPIWVKVYINNDSYKTIDLTKPLNFENGGYTGYTMQPSPIQTSPGQSNTPPYDYTLGVDYEYITQLPPGPHTYYFAAYDGKSYAIFPARPDDWTYIRTYSDWWVPGRRSGDPEGLDNNYIPGPYINNACQLSLPSVTPASGTQGRNYTYRVFYKDPDGQRPFQASVYIETGNPALGEDGVIKADMVQEDPTATDYKTGVWFVLNTASLENFSLAQGIRHYRFEFIDDWGRQTDPNDLVKGETTRLPVSGGWIDGPTIGENIRPTLRNGKAISTDGTSNTATVWQFTVTYRDLNNDAPQYVTVFLGKLSEDGTSIEWDSGHDMSKIDPNDNVYSDGCDYAFSTRLAGAQNPGDYEPVYYYAFVASDGVNVATWVPADYPDENARSESAGELLKDPLVTSDQVVYTASKAPLVGTLPAQPVRPGVMIDPVVWKYPGGDPTAGVIVTRDDDYTIQGYCLDRYNVVRYEPEDPATRPSISSIVGVWLYPDLSGTDYFHTDDGTPGSYDPVSGKITLARPLPAGTVFVYVKYHHDGDYTLDRMTGEFTFFTPQDPADTFNADYLFATLINSPIASNQMPILESPKLVPMVGSTFSDFTYTVIYKEMEGINGQPPAFVRVVIDGTARDMTPVVSGTPSYRSGVTFRYVAKLPSGSHTYYFEASDGVGLVTLPLTNAVTGTIEPFNGPWVNDPPTLTNGLANPNPSPGSISTQQPVVYSIVFTDPDNDPPIAYKPFATDPDAQPAIQNLTFQTPLLFIDNANETFTVGTVAELLPDPAQPTKMRLIRVLDKNGNTPSYSANQFAGKILQFLDGPLAGRTYLIAESTADTFRLVVDDLVTEGLNTGIPFSVAVLEMFKANPTAANYAVGVTYALTIPQLAEGQHNFHFKAASVMIPPSWVGAPYNTITMSSWVRYPTSGELSGPKVVVVPPDTNRAPVLSMQAGDVPVSPTSGKPTDTFDFYVTYRDDDGDPPRLHDNNVQGYIRVVFNDGTFSAPMMPEIPETGTNFYMTPRRMTVRAVGLPQGSHKFHFEASDGWVAVRYPALVQGADPTANDPVVVVNSKPSLTNIVVSPPSGSESTTFTFSVKYSDADGDPPITNGVWVEIDGPADPLYLTRNPSDNDWVNGVTFTGTRGSFSSGVHTTTFKAVDAVGESSSVTGPTFVVTENLNVPVLENPQVFNTASPTLINDDAIGSSASLFRYKITYRDADGNRPVVLKNGVAVEGVELYIDGVLETTLGTAQRVGDDFVAGVVYQYDRPGTKYSSGAHTYYFKATDDLAEPTHTVQTDVTNGPTIVSAGITLAALPESPNVGDSVTINGLLSGTTAKPIAGYQRINVGITKPDGTGQSLSLTANASNQFTIPLTPTMNGQWLITARWDGNSDYPTGAVRDLRLTVKGPTRVVATADMTQPVTSAPVMDMVTMPMVPFNYSVLNLFGSDRINLMTIYRWDPVAKVYLRYGSGTFPAVGAGTALWIKPAFSYPAETYDTLNPPYPVDPDYIPSAGNSYRLFKPFGTLWPQTSDCEISLKAGWNMVGSPFLTPVDLSSVKVKVGAATYTLDQAASASPVIVRNYMWMFDPVSQIYRLTHSTRPDAYSRTVDPWRGYWIRAFQDCTLVLPAPGSGRASVSRSQVDEGPTSRAPLATLDSPPPSPSGSGN